MNKYEQNYWSLYLDFLDDFQSLTYKGYSISFLCHYRSLLNKLAKGTIGQASYSRHIKNHVKDVAQVQTKFNFFKDRHKKVKKTIRDGKIVFHDVYKLLRFPKETFIKYFDPKKTIILNEGKVKKVREKPKRRKSKRSSASKRKQQKSPRMNKPKKKNASIPRKSLITRHSFKRFQSNNKEAIQKLKKQAVTIINKFKGHPLYSNSVFKQRFLMQIGKIVNRIEEASKLFRQINVSAVVVPSTHYPESRTLVMVAAEHGIPTVCMQHGIISGEYGYIPKIADYDAVYGKFEVDWYSEKGADPHSLEIVGHPRFDLIHKAPKVSRKELIKKLGLHPNKKNMLIIVRGSAQIKAWKTFLNKFRGNRDLNIIVKDFPNSKPHPLTKSHSFVRSAHGCQLYDLIHLSDMVVSYSSTVGLEAMLAKKTVFILNEPFHGYSGYYTGLGKLVQKDPDKLAVIIREYLKSNKMREFTREKIASFLSYCYPGNHASGKRLSNLINKIINGST